MSLSKRYKRPQGWHNESGRHALSARGIPNASASQNTNNYPVRKIEPTELPKPEPETTLPEIDEGMTEGDTESWKRGFQDASKALGSGLSKVGSVIGENFRGTLGELFGGSEEEANEKLMQDVHSVVLTEEQEEEMALLGDLSHKTKGQLEVVRELSDLENAREGGFFGWGYKEAMKEKRETIMDAIKESLGFGQYEQARESIFEMEGHRQSYIDKMSIVNTIKSDIMSRDNRNGVELSEQFNQINQVDKALAELKEGQKRAEDDIIIAKTRYNNEMKAKASFGTKREEDKGYFEFLFS
jgi:hypothetical protein